MAGIQYHGGTTKSDRSSSWQNLRPCPSDQGAGDGDAEMGYSDDDNANNHNHKLTVEDPTSNLHSLFQLCVSKKKNIYSRAPVPLNTPWTFWVDRTQRGVGVEQYEANLKRIYTVYTVHRFWGVFYNIPKPSDLHVRASLHMMRDERKPIWEETYNCVGGTFKFRCQKKDTDKVWRELLMAAIGEQLNEFVSQNDEVCGISVTVRDREDTIQIWNTNHEVADQARIFDCVHMLLPDTNFVSQFYKPHVAHHAFEKEKAGPNGASASSSATTTASTSSH